MKEKIPVSPDIDLTPFTPADTANLLLYLNDIHIYQNTLLIPFPYTEKDAEQWVQFTQEESLRHGNTHQWAIRHDAAGCIGGIGAFLRTGPEGHRDEIGYWIGAPFRGQDIMTRVVRVFCGHMFAQRPKLVRIEAQVHVPNSASAQVLKKAGFEQEAILRKYQIKQGNLLDVIQFALFRADGP